MVMVWHHQNSPKHEIFSTFGQKTTKILEVGLQSTGFEHLYGVELQHYAAEKARKIQNNINVIQGSAFDIRYIKLTQTYTFAVYFLLRSAAIKVIALGHSETLSFGWFGTPQAFKPCNSRTYFLNLNLHSNLYHN